MKTYLESGENMKALLTEDGVVAGETFLCGTCFYGPDGAQNQAYAREQASQSDDVNPESNFEDCTGHVAPCCICGVYEIIEGDTE